jgi:PPOX class probable F420-dependent enzyme
MTTLNDAGPQELLEKPNYAVVSTFNHDGSIHNTVVWISSDNGAVSVNSAIGRLWPTNLQRDPRVTVLVQETGNPYHFVEIRGKASASTEDADDHINALTKKYTGQDEYPWRQPGEQRVRFAISPDHVRYFKQG